MESAHTSSEPPIPNHDFQRIASCNELWWNGVYKKLLRSFVFVDDHILELLHWNGGLAPLLEANIVGIKSLSDPDKKLSSDPKKAAFLVSEILGNDSQQLAEIQSIIESNNFEYCIVISVPPHYSYILQKHRWIEDATTSQIRGTPLFERLETLLIEWMGNANSFHTDWELLSNGLKESVQNFVGCWHNLMASLDAKEDCYCVGPLSSIIATRLANYFPAKARRKTARNHVSLIFVDRTVDFLEPVKCPVTPILDRMLFSFEKLLGHSTERRIDIDHESGFPGSLFHARTIDDDANSVFQCSLTDTMQNSALIAVNLLESIFIEKNIRVPEKQIAVLDRLKEMIQTLRDDEDLALDIAPLYEAALTIHMAYSETSSQKQKHQKWGKLVKRARHSQFTLEKLEKLAQTDSLSIEEILICLIAMASATPKNLNDQATEEAVGWISDVLLANAQEEELPSYLRRRDDEDYDEMTSREAVKEMFLRLKNYTRLKGVLELGKSGNFLTGLLEQILDPSDPEIPDLVCKTTGLTDVLRSGIGLFTNVLGQGSRPTDAKTLIIFVLGGASAGELSDMFRVMDRNTRRDTEVIIGTNRIICARDLLETQFEMSI